jgi:hypothetical protein
LARPNLCLTIVVVRRYPILLVVGALTFAAVGATAAPAPVGATDTAPYSFSPTHGGSSTPFTIRLAEVDIYNPRCGELRPPSTVVFETSYIFPSSTYPGYGYWDTFRRPMGGFKINVAGGGFPFQSNLSPGDPYLTPPPLTFLDVAGLTPGVYHVGITCAESCFACVLPAGAVYVNSSQISYDTVVTITEDLTDPNGFTWRVGADPPSEVPEAPFPVALSLSTIGLGLGGLIWSRRRQVRTGHS